ncbi:MAG: GNAT family N-acetyltransferase [Marinagarivorans sp.]
MGFGVVLAASGIALKPNHLHQQKTFTPHFLCIRYAHFTHKKYYAKVSAVLGVSRPREIAMNIRPATLSDARQIAEVHVSSWQYAYRGLVPDSYLDRLSVDKRETAWQRSISDGAPELWVAEQNSKILGWVAFGPSRDDDASPSVGEIEAIYILPDYWRQGVGRELWLVAQNRLIARNFSTVTLWVLTDNERAIQFYLTIGFSLDHHASRASERDGKVLTEARYESALG